MAGGLLASVSSSIMCTCIGEVLVIVLIMS